VTEPALTVSVALPDFPSSGAVAVMVVTPTPVPVAFPVVDTEATAGILELQENTRPARTLPDASFAVAVNGVLSPATTVCVAGTSVIVAMGTNTVMDAVPLFPSLVAVIVALPPADVALTSPADDTVATAALLVVHVTVRPLSTSPAESLVTAVN
jgi:hypothetical protein